MFQSVTAVALLVSLAITQSEQNKPDAAAVPKPRSGSSKWNVAIVIYNQMELLDFAGPAETFQAAGQGWTYNVFTVAETVEPIISQRFVTITPQFTIANCPPPDLVVIPGGNSSVVRKSQKMMDWVKAVSREAQCTFTVCTGAFVLAQAGLLDGLEATTHHSALATLRRDYPKIKVRSDRRVVDNGNIVTAAGVSAGIDGALHIVARMRGQAVARRTAEYMEYKWQPEPAAVSGERLSADAMRQIVDQCNRKAIEDFKKGDTLAVSHGYADDATIYFPRGEKIRGRQALDRYWQAIKGVKDWKLETFEVGGTKEAIYEVGKSTLTTEVDGKESTYVCDYVVIWKRQKDGTYLAHTDIYN
jgi:putative intracellular protease/amidase/ketosteroid isomerase-like protein